eukprot:tig00000681_g3108.t1
MAAAPAAAPDPDLNPATGVQRRWFAIFWALEGAGDVPTAFTLHRTQRQPNPPAAPAPAPYRIPFSAAQRDELQRIRDGPEGIHHIKLDPRGIVVNDIISRRKDSDGREVWHNRTCGPGNERCTFRIGIIPFDEAQRGQIRQAVREFFNESNPPPKASEIYMLPWHGTLFPVREGCTRVRYAQSGTEACAPKPWVKFAGQGSHAPTCWRDETRQRGLLQIQAKGNPSGTEACTRFPPAYYGDRWPAAPPRRGGFYDNAWLAGGG